MLLLLFPLTSRFDFFLERRFEVLKIGEEKVIVHACN